MKENNNKNGRGVFYGVIGVATLVVAIIGATFAYFTAAATNGANVINGNMANVSFDLAVEKVVDPGASTGMIPMSNNMVEAAASNASTKGVCVDANGNAVCQIYKITVTNNSSATMFVDGYVALAGGSGIPTDITPVPTTPDGNNTTMRWAQVFTHESAYSTAGVQHLAADKSTDGDIEFANPLATTSTEAFNAANIKQTAADVYGGNDGTVSISNNSYDAVKTNYIRVSNHAITAGSEGNPPTINLTPDFTRTNDVTSMLVINQQLGSSTAANHGNVAEYYFVVWLSETGHNQTPTQTTTAPTDTTNPAANNFFSGIVRFISAQGSEVTATFSGYTAVRSDNAATTANQNQGG